MKISRISNFRAGALHEYLVAREYLMFAHFPARKCDVREIFPFRRCAEIRLREIANMENESICV